MKCPIDSTDLVMADRQGIEIDYCPKCRGIWLDRGELDKLIERSAAAEPASPAAYAPAPSRAEPAPRAYRHDDDDDDRRYDRRDPRYRKRKSFLGDIFDFD
jgi:uncharacterized protein